MKIGGVKVCKWNRQVAEKVVLTVVIVVGVAISLSSCTTVVESPPQPRVKIDADKSVRIVSTCDNLGFVRGGEGHRLCVLRGIDRYVDHQTVPLSERYQRVPECAQYPCSR